MRLVKYRKKWCAYVKRGRRISLHTEDRDVAERRLADLKAQANRKTVTVAQIVTEYMEARKNLPSHKVMKFYWKNTERHFGNLLPEHVTGEVCQAYIKSRPSAAAETLRKEIGLVRAALRWKNKATPAVFQLPPASPPRGTYLTRDQCKVLLNACERDYLKLYILLAVQTAGRKAAILELTWDRVDFEKGMIALGKGDKRLKARATVPMNESLRIELEKAREVSLSEYVIEHGARQIKEIGKGFRQAAKRAKLKVTPHDLRRTAAVWMAEDRVPMAEIAAYLGHKNSKITEEVYAKYSPDYLRKASKSLEI